MIFHNSTLAEIVRRAASRDELAAVPGVGPAKLERYGDDVLAVLAAGGGAAGPRSGDGAASVLRVRDPDQEQLSALALGHAGGSFPVPASMSH